MDATDGCDAGAVIDEDADADVEDADDGWDAGAAVAAELRWTRAPLPAPWVQSGQVSSIFLTTNRDAKLFLYKLSYYYHLWVQPTRMNPQNLDVVKNTNIVIIRLCDNVPAWSYPIISILRWYVVIISRYLQANICQAGTGPSLPRWSQPRLSSLLLTAQILDP